jgi:hypothetical protein
MSQRKIEEMTFDEFANKMAHDVIEKKILKFNDDHVILVCGDEGKRKSTFTLALACEVYRKLGREPTSEILKYSWPEYREANLFALKNMKPTLTDPRQAMKMVKEYGIDDDNTEELQKIWAKGIDIKKGDILVFDEACEINARDSMSQTNKDFTGLMIKNRFLGLLHFLNIPKPMSLDIYPREQRARGMIWCCADYNNEITDRIARVYYYTKETYSEIFAQKRYWNLFTNQDKLIRAVPPDFQITDMGDLRRFIPVEIATYYESKKWAFNYSGLLADALGKNKRTFNKDKCVRPGESKLEWFERTGVDPTRYSAYKIFK